MELSKEEKIEALLKQRQYLTREVKNLERSLYVATVEDYNPDYDRQNLAKACARLRNIEAELQRLEEK